MSVARNQLLEASEVEVFHLALSWKGCGDWLIRTHNVFLEAHHQIQIAKAWRGSLSKPTGYKD